MVKVYNLGYNLGTTRSPIIPILLSDDMQTFKLGKLLEDEGVCQSSSKPCIPPGYALIRKVIQPHTQEEMDFVLENSRIETTRII